MLPGLIATVVWIVLAMAVNGLVFRWLGGFDSAGRAVQGWGNRRARKWARRRGLKPL
jgi:hypothetical protein